MLLSGLATDWEGLARDDLEHTKSLKLDYGKAKNVILFVGDGMGPATVTAGRTYMAQTNNMDDVTTSLSWEKFPITGLSKVRVSIIYCFRGAECLRKDALKYCDVFSLKSLEKRQHSFRLH